MIGLLGGAFDPPHNGHLALGRAALEQLPLEQLRVLVVARPAHKEVATPVDARLRLAEAAFEGLPRTTVELEEHAYTADSVRRGRFGDAIFLIGADQFADFLTWKEPEVVLEHVRLGVATRPGYPRERLEEVLARLPRPERVVFFEIEPLAISSREVRARVARGDEIDTLVPPAVARLVVELGLYRGAGLH